MAIHETHELVDDFTDFLREYYHDDIGELAQKYPTEQQSITVDFEDLYVFDMDLADDLREEPRRVLEQLETALEDYDIPAKISLDGASVRLHNLPETATFDVGAYRSNHVGNIISVTGQAKKKTEVKPRPQELAYECQRCGTITTIPQESGNIQSPHECNGCERQGPFQIDHVRSNYTDHQLIRLQQPPEQVKGGQGADVDVHIEGELVGQVDAGDRVTVSGIMSLDDDDPENQTAFDPYLDGRGIQIEETDYEDIDVTEHEADIRAIARGERGDPFELLADSIAPKVEGMGEIKEALVLQLFGGVRKEYPDGSSDRGDSHVLLLGDPGTAKSKILKAVENIAPRGVFASGKGASAAGMTAAAVNDDFGDNSWTLEAGALVLANNGIACVDEIDKVDEEAVNSMHTALEQQSIHVNKAGINTTLPTRTALLAAGNPKRGRFDPNTSYAEQIDLDPAMISRFDLMFMVDDRPSDTRDTMIAEGVLDSHDLGGRYVDDPGSLSDEEMQSISAAIDEETLRAYVAYAKQEVTPKLTPEFKESLRDWYVDLRSVYGDAADAPVPVTARKLEGIVRLAEASARVRLSETVSEGDLERAKRLALRSMRDVGMDPETGQFDADIVETGTSTSQRDRMRNIKQYIAEVERESGKPVSKDDILDWARENGWGKNQTIHEIGKLKKQGDLYSPDNDESYRTT